uniref:Surface glycan-binding protein B xyloglucan binding domain-containing protein n=1 Tax=Prevotella sp. GTC17262 TaxID=3236797 RepID=A0AB33JDT6_9BACT
MKKIKQHTSFLIVMLMAMFSFVLAACGDDKSGGGQPEITSVKILSSDTLNYSYEQTYTKASPGTMLALMGVSLNDARKVYVNNQEVYFNPTMNTDHSIIITVPSEADGFKLSAFDSSIPDEIRVETSHGTATYSFKITAPGPQLQRLEAAYPRKAGNVVKLYGLNLVDIQKMYITDTMSGVLDTTTWEEVPGKHYAISTYKSITQDHHLNESTQGYETTSVLAATLPAQFPDSGSVVIECAGGIAYVGFSVIPSKPVITSVSSDMPQIGEDLVILGRDFVQVESVSYGDVKLTSSDFRVSASEDSIIVPFKKKPAKGSEMKLTVKTPGGSTSVERFYDYSTILTTFDGDATDNGWGPNALYPDAGNEDGKFAHINVDDNGSNFWGTMVFFRKDWSGPFTLSTNIPNTASAKDVYLAYNVFDNNSAFNSTTFSGMIRYMIEKIGGGESYWGGPEDGGFKWIVYNESWEFTPPVLADVNGEAHKGKWYRVVIPLDNFACFKGMDYANIVKTGINQFRFMEFNGGANKGHVDVKIDNVRVIYIPSK